MSRAISWPDPVPPVSFQKCSGEPFVPNRAIVALDIGVLLGFARLDIFNRYAPFLGPLHQQATYIFRAVVDPNGRRFAAPFNDPVQAAHDTHGGQREVHLDPQPFAIEVIQNVQRPE